MQGEEGESTIAAPATVERNTELGVVREREAEGTFIVEGVWQGAEVNLGTQREEMCTHKVSRLILEPNTIHTSIYCTPSQFLFEK